MCIEENPGASTQHLSLSRHGQPLDVLSDAAQRQLDASSDPAVACSACNALDEIGRTSSVVRNPKEKKKKRLSTIVILCIQHLRPSTPSQHRKRQSWTGASAMALGKAVDWATHCKYSKSVKSHRR